MIEIIEEYRHGRFKQYLRGGSADDIDAILRKTAEDPYIETKPVICHSCGGELFKMRVDADEGAVMVKCSNCGKKEILLDCDEIWSKAKPKPFKCPVCGSRKKHNCRVGFIRRENGDVEWVYIGSRCTKCGALSPVADWEITYGPTATIKG